MNREKLLGLLISLFCMASHAHAAGGHFAVDDAVMLEPGQCQVETWGDRLSGGGRQVHVGPGCRVGPVELGLGFDHTRVTGSGSTTAISPEVKWARQLTDAWAFGAVLSASWQDTERRYAGSSLVVPLTWQPAKALLIHVNIGRDFRRGEPDSNRAGAAVEWAASERWSLLAERFREEDTNHWRAGARYALSSAVNLDFSRTRGLHDTSWWTLGLNWEFNK